MRDYEITVILRPDLEEKKIDAWVKFLETLLDKFSTKVKGKISITKKPLAYEIKKLREGQYVFCEAQGDPSKLTGIDTALKNDDNVLRYLIIKKIN